MKVNHLKDGLFSPYNLTKETGPISVVGMRLSIRVARPSVYARFRRILTNIIGSIRITYSPIFIILTSGNRPIKRRRVKEFTFQCYFRLHVRRNFYPFSLSVFHLTRYLHILPLYFNKYFQRRMRLRGLMLVPTICTAIGGRKWASIHRFTIAWLRQEFLCW